MGTIALLVTCFVPLALGASLLRAIGIGFASDRLAYVGWAWLAGTLGTAAIELLWLLAGGGVRSPLLLSFTVLAVVALCAVLGSRRSSEPSVPVHTPAGERAFFALAVSAVLLLTAYRVVSSSLQAIIENDEAIFWSYRAKVLFQSGGFGGDYGVDLARERPPNGDYPLLNPLLQLWVFIQAGRVTDVVNRVPIQLVSLALVLVLAAGLRRLVRPAVAGLLLFLPFTWYDLASAARHAHSDVMVAIGLVVALDAYLRWRTGGRRVWVALASLGVTFALWSKHDGELYVLAFLAAALLSNLGRSRALVAGIRPARLVWTLPPLAVLAFTWAHNALFDVENYFMSGAELNVPFPILLWRQISERLPTISARFWRDIVLDPRSSYVLLAIPVLAALAPRAMWRGPVGVAVLAYLLACAGMMLIFIGLPRDLDWIMITASGRIAAQILPAAVLLLAALARELSERLRPAPGRASSSAGAGPHAA